MTDQSANCIETAKRLAHQVSDTELEQRLNVLLTSPTIANVRPNTKQNKKQNKTKQNKTKQNKTKQNKTKQNKTKQNKTKQNQLMLL
jgi:hypothetical protein